MSTGSDGASASGDYLAAGYVFTPPAASKTVASQPAQSDALAALNSSVEGMKANVNSMVQAEMEKMKTTINEMMAAAGQSTAAGFP